MRRSRRGFMAAAAALILTGCGGDSGSDDSGPTDQQIFLVQRSSEASSALTRIYEATSKAILASGSGTPTPGPHAVPVYPGATPAFDFAANVDVLLDFDALDIDGNDSDPDASGQVRVTATGTLTGDETAGTATFSASVVVEADLTLDNTDSDVETSVPAGASWSYILEVEWTATDSKNWSVTAIATTSVDVQDVVVDDGVEPVTVDTTAERIVTSSFSRTNGKVSHERLFEGSMTTSVDDGETVETVDFEWTKPGRVRISVVGHVFGPLNEGQVRSLFRTLIQ